MYDQDKLAIIELLNLYGYAMDSQSWHLFDQIFTPDADVLFSDTAQSHWTDLEAFKKDFEDFHTTLDGSHHAMSGHIVNVQGDHANSITYGAWRLIKHGVTGGDLWEGSGWYDDVLKRTEHGWRITSRICRTFWWGGNVRVIETVPGVRFDLPIDSMRAIREAGQCRFTQSLGAKGLKS